jgi:AraC-like DNA-binding protein
MPEIAKFAPHARYVPRQGEVNAWDNEAYVNAVRETGKKTLIMAGVWTGVCVMFPALDAKAAGFNVYAVMDASGDPTEFVSRTTLARFTQAGIVPTSTNVVICELHRPRQSLVSHLGFEPQGGLYRRRGTPAGRLLFDLIRSSDDDEESALSPADSYMQLAVYDLVGALFAPTEPSSASRHADKLFARIRGIIRDGCADPDFGPPEGAAEAGISLRYLQKLFTQRGSTCSDFIYSLRLDQAARLLAGDHWERGSLSAKSPTFAAFATTRISRESFGNGSVTRQRSL